MRRIAALWLAAGMALGSCSRTPEPVAAFDQVYTTRGIIRALPDPDRPGAGLSIQHEEIPEFVNGAGESVGMRSMTMPFPTLADGVSLEGLEAGDRVRFTFGVTWSPAASGSTRPIPGWTLTHIEELPADTRLDFEG